MSEAKILYCSGCGEALDININQSFVFCKYCGAKNIIDSQQMKSNVNFGNVNISANVDSDSLVASAEYAISIGDFDKANDLLLSAVMSGNADYRIYMCKAKIDLVNGNDKSLFESLEKLQKIENNSNNHAISEAINELMTVRGVNGVIALHNASFHERLDLVEFCVEHGADVNCRAGMNNVTPLTILYVPVNPNTSRLDGTPFVRDKVKVKQIREYLLAHGALDSKTEFRRLIKNNPSGTKSVNKTLYCVMAFLFGGYGIHKFLEGNVKAGVLYLLFSWTYIPTILGIMAGVKAILKPADAMGHIEV